MRDCSGSAARSSDPHTAKTVWAAIVVTPSLDGRAEIKRLWTDPDSRGRGIAAALITAAVDHATGAGARVVQLSVWNWRTGAIRLYESLGFTTTDSWDPRDHLLCLERLL